ncbi:MAG: HAD family phosphatase [Chloroflexi bacterium]|nr:HAD family phosphatase [Chloroflexota bacterium]
MKIDTVIFDFGGVFTEPLTTAFEALGAELGLTPEQIKDIMIGPSAVDTDHPWHRLERGEISLSQARDEILRLGREAYGREADIYRFFDKMPRDAGLRHELVERVRRLKRDRYATGMITNNIREFSDGWRALLPVGELFDVVVDSSKEGMRKPNPAIFLLTLERMGGLAPERTVFIDDFEANVAVASSLGMRTVHVTGDVSRTIADLDAMLSL